MRGRCMRCIFSPGDEQFSVFQRSLVYKAFLSKLARCSKQPNYWVKPGLSLPRAQHPASVSDPRELHLSSLPMSFTPLALPGLRLLSHCYRTSAPEPPAGPGIQDVGKSCFLGNGNSDYDAAWHLIRAAVAFVLMFAETRVGVSLNNGWY